jgi:UDP-N-acetyl-D-glucosamine dehydrogenase
MRETPVLKIIGLLEKNGAQVSYSDPYVPEFVHNERTYKSIEINPETLRNSDLVIIATDHGKFDYDLVYKYSPLILDTRNALKNIRDPKIFRL